MGEMASRLFKKSTKEWNAWRRHNPRVELDFSGENPCNSSLVGADLRRIKFDGAELCDVDLSRADLSRTSLKATLLQRAKLNRADLQDVDLRKADLQWAILDNANLSRATLEEANLEYAKLNRAILDGANLRATTAMGAEFNGASLIHVDLDGADLVGCGGQSAQIDQASLIATDLSGEERRPFNRKRIAHILQTGELLSTFGQIGSLEGISRELALTLVHYELLLHTQDCRIWWVRVGDASDAGFRQTRRLTSLWGAIWELFGLETLGGRGWGLCDLPECRRFFYPIRSDSTCCSPKHQALWSKRRWAREHRQ